mmetsp:Transcript_23520/g.59835  ORF Transcript_23520/g.59835 Transcript_23520/m.59835 type:complete len:281 (-) Transcript_23520:370-1212(-)
MSGLRQRSGPSRPTGIPSACVAPGTIAASRSFLRTSSLIGSSTFTRYRMSFSRQMRGSYSSGMMMSRKRPASFFFSATRYSSCAVRHRWPRSVVAARRAMDCVIECWIGSKTFSCHSRCSTPCLRLASCLRSSSISPTSATSVASVRSISPHNLWNSRSMFASCSFLSSLIFSRTFSSRSACCSAKSPRLCSLLPATGAVEGRTIICEGCFVPGSEATREAGLVSRTPSPTADVAPGERAPGERGRLPAWLGAALPAAEAVSNAFVSSCSAVGRRLRCRD